jgi:protein subunit release factor A
VKIRAEDLRADVFTATPSDPIVRLTHLTTGIVVFAQHASSIEAKALALKELKRKLKWLHDRSCCKHPESVCKRNGGCSSSCNCGLKERLAGENRGNSDYIGRA